MYSTYTHIITSQKCRHWLQWPKSIHYALQRRCEAQQQIYKDLIPAAMSDGWDSPFRLCTNQRLPRHAWASSSILPSHFIHRPVIARQQRRSQDQDSRYECNKCGIINNRLFFKMNAVDPKQGNAARKCRAYTLRPTHSAIMLRVIRWDRRGVGSPGW